MDLAIFLYCANEISYPTTPHRIQTNAKHFLTFKLKKLTFKIQYVFLNLFNKRYRNLE